jgi:hypothetical protein
MGLISHGIGIGSFVYLRRIFEDLIEEAHSVAKQEPDWNENDFSKLHMDEKVKLLKFHLPKFLSDNYSIYSILSKGIHSLSEDECLKYFDTLKQSIELILDEKIEKIERLKKLDEMQKSISDIKSKIK